MENAVDQRDRLYGEFRHAIDAKNRLFIPAKFREEIGETFYLTRRILDPCLAIYSEKEWKTFSDKVNSLPDSKVRKIKQLVFPKTTLVTPDSHGRILIPANLLEYAQIEKTAVVTGAGDHIEIWNETKWDILQKQLEGENLEDICYECGL